MRCTAWSSGRVVGVAQRLGLFAQLLKGPATAGRVAEELELQVAGTRLLCENLAGLDDPRAGRPHLLAAQALAQVARPGFGHLHRHVAGAHDDLLGVVRRSRAHRARRRQLRDPSRGRRGRGVLEAVHHRPVRAGPAVRAGSRQGDQATATDRRRCSTSPARTAGSRRSCASATRRCMRPCSTCPAARASGARSSPPPA